MLIYASLEERCAELLADTGVVAKVPIETWDEIIAKLVVSIKAGVPGDGFVEAVEHCGRILAAHFPAHVHNLNELPNAIVDTSQAEF